MKDYKLNRPQTQVMLHMLGVDYIEQTTSLKEARQQLAIIKSTNPDEYNRVFDHVVYGKKTNLRAEKIKDEEFVAPPIFEKLLDLAEERRNILVVGNAGTGKTYIAEKVAEQLQLDFSSQSCSSGISESVFTGWLLPIGEAGKFEYVQSEFVRIYENGGVFLFDEMDAADDNVLVFLNKALANDSFHLPQRYNKPLVRKHKDFVAIAAANTYGHGATAVFHGRNALDGATLDRFRVGTLDMDYNLDLERQVAKGNEELLYFVWAVREIINKHGLLRIMSTRVLIDGCRMINNKGWTFKNIKEGYFTDWTNEEIALVNTELNKTVASFKEKEDNTPTEKNTSNPPDCPKCGKQMILRKNNKPHSKRFGEEFWGCVDYPKCFATIKLEDVIDGVAA